MDIPCTRSGTRLTLFDFPDNFTTEDAASEFRVFGEIRGIEYNPDPGTFDIEFSSAKTAAVAQQYVMAPYMNAMGSMMNPMMGGQMMNPMMNPMAMMNPMINPMMNPMMQMMNGSMMGNMGSARQNRTAIRSPPKPSSESQASTSQAKLSITTNGDGNRQFSTRNGSEGGESSDTNANNQDGVTVAVGPCTLCVTRTSYTCGRCGVFYCSRECQKKNWPDHQNKCNSGLPPLNYAGQRRITEIEIVQYDTEHGRLSPVVNGSVQSNIQQAAGNRMRSPQFGARSEPSMNGRDNRSGRDDRNGTDYRDGRNANQMGLRPAEHQGPSAGRSSRSPRSMGQDVPLRKPHHSAEMEKRSPRFTSRDVPEKQPPSPAEVEKPTATPVQSESPKRPSIMSRIMKNLPGTGATPVSPGAQQAGTPPTSPPDARTEIPSCVQISSGDLVSISHFEQNSVYLQSTSPQNVKQMVEMFSELKDYCAKAEPLDRQPKKQEFLAVKYSQDDTYYRAVVIKKPNKSESLFDVCFVDYGNIDKGVPISRMVSLTDSLAKVPIMSSKTRFNKVPDAVLSSEAKDLLNSYFVKEMPLKVEFSGRFEDGVTLIDQKSGESLNEKILKALGIGDSVATPTISPSAAPTGILRLLPTRSPVVVPEPTPAPVVVPAPTPAPVVVPAPTPAPVVVPAPTPAPVVVPAPTPVSVVVPAPTPAPVVVPAPAPAPVVVPAPAPAPVVVPAPTPAPLAPTPAQSAPRKFYIDQIDTVKFPIKGTKLDVIVHSIMEDHGILMASPTDMAALEAAGDLMVQFEAYAATVQPYIPDENELCIAKWTDDCWYRAACMSVESDKVTVIFLEYGNVDTIPLADVRPFKEEFMSVPAISTMCVLSGPELTNAQKAKLKGMQKDGWVVSATVVEIVEGPLVTLDIPEIRQNL